MRLSRNRKTLGPIRYVHRDDSGELIPQRRGGDGFARRRAWAGAAARVGAAGVSRSFHTGLDPLTRLRSAVHHTDAK
jgi:hypothetical protein